jgi:hypothetical protein
MTDLARSDSLANLLSLSFLSLSEALVISCEESSVYVNRYLLHGVLAYRTIVGWHTLCVSDHKAKASVLVELQRYPRHVDQQRHPNLNTNRRLQVEYRVDGIDNLDNLQFERGIALVKYLHKRGAFGNITSAELWNGEGLRLRPLDSVLDEPLFLSMENGDRSLVDPKDTDRSNHGALSLGGFNYTLRKNAKKAKLSHDLGDWYNKTCSSAENSLRRCVHPDQALIILMELEMSTCLPICRQMRYAIVEGISAIRDMRFATGKQLLQDARSE